MLYKLYKFQYFLIISINSLMLLKNQLRYKLKEEYLKVFDHCLTYENGLVFSGLKRHRLFCLTHINEDGKILGELQFPDDGPESMVLPTTYTVLSLFPCSNMILHWDLVTHEATQINFSFLVQDNFCSKFMIFPETGRICIQENGSLGDSSFRLTYFDLPLTKESEPVHIFDDENHAWTHDHSIICKGNSHQMVCWLATRFSKTFDFFTYTPNQGLKHYQVPNTVGEKYGQANTDINTAAMWEMRPDQFLFVTHSSRTKPEGEIINNNYVVNVSENIIREAKFIFKNNDEQQLHIHQMNFGNTGMIRTIAFNKGEALQTPIYYIRNSTEIIVAEETWRCSHLNKYHIPGYDENMLIQGIYANGNVRDLTIQTKKIMQGQEITTYLMTQLENFDHDLIYDVVQLIDYA